MRLTKHHGLGNDFLVTSDPRGLDPDVARAVCDRTRGIGADGLLHVAAAEPAAGDGADVTMVLHNADGSRAEMSGNGIGCLAQAAILRRLAKPPTVTVRTDAGLRTVSYDLADGVATVSMGVPAIGDDEPEWTDNDILRAVRVDVGNPHLVLQAADPDRVADREWVAALGRAANAAVAGGINVEVVTPGDDGLVMDVYERGVGLTSACGTGAVATAVAAHRWGLAGDRTTVRMTGGPVTVDLGAADGQPTLATPIVYVGEVHVPT